jgi:hypothetical protein
MYNEKFYITPSNRHPFYADEGRTRIISVHNGQWAFQKFTSKCDNHHDGWMTFYVGNYSDCRGKITSLKGELDHGQPDFI